MNKPGSNAIEVNGNLVRELRLAAFLTQKEVADRAGIGIERLSRLENNVQTRMYRSTVRALAEVLGVSPVEITLPTK